MQNCKADYWTFIEKIHDLTEYVQELLRQNGRLKQRLDELEKQREDRDAQISSLRKRLGSNGNGNGAKPGDEGSEIAATESEIWRPSLQLDHPRVRTC